MNISIERNAKNTALLKKLASKNVVEAAEAQVSLAEFIGPILQQVINTAPVLSNRWQTLEFNEGDSPSLPLDLYRDVFEDNFFNVWSQSEAGGVPWNQPMTVQKELKFTTYSLDSAVAFAKKYAQQGRLDVVAKAMTRLAQEVLLKQERNSAALVLAALAEDVKRVDGTTTGHVIRSHTAGEFKLHDYNRLFTFLKRLHTAWNGGTPVSRSRGLTDIYVSPEIVEDLRAMAYNPINTKVGAVVGTPGANAAAATGIALTDAQRQQIFASAGIPEFYDVAISEYNELGVGYKYNDAFAKFAGNTTFPGNDGGSDAAFDPNTEEILLGFDFSNTASFFRPVAVDGEGGPQFTVEPDNQFVTRSGKIGFYGKLEEGRIIADTRALVGMIV